MTRWFVLGIGASLLLALCAGCAVQSSHEAPSVREWSGSSDAVPAPASPQSSSPTDRLERSRQDDTIDDRDLGAGADKETLPPAK